ncbi:MULTISPECIES: M48 family metallopeptidase [Bradyrhizobium]|uniref:M48 family metallopeptidase n=1 Tax=Bradyrhizobium TaxID=374 RepID=UPI00155F3B5F|nr:MULTISPECIES: SprT family zinc-dependent metalloprotease [Bradyrhizobium]MDD1523454.1 metal-dependent hydrolase [Bradyrhizobium sp. WBAH30]MDD1547540.1 metal-dependent hydrolase [Bradyrhizobium sp. WBAH41]MDD1561179.1 metal-dependent hydrolase [Bradyrhizobium sp. WBAH23]MDD1568655.1 metal-dependent hydrolase [Bradyrhizobium sp. WBAH33]MDD1594633.1 metal-dependent hydrolase [Bradyrhizobium sp. WBAH42]
MQAELNVGGIAVDVLFKDIKNVHLSVYPPTGRVRISAPQRMSLENVRLFAISKIGWIKRHQGKITRQPRETPREYLERESHYVWGRRYLLTIKKGGSRPVVALSHKTLALTLPEGTSASQCEDALAEWYRTELRERAAPLLAKWARLLNVELERFYIQRMKTKWGSSSPARKTVRLNLELAKFSPECLDYVALHEIAHFVVPNHTDKFVALLNRHMPGWPTIRDRLNEGPLPAITG